MTADVLEVLDGGLQTTVQDLGRPDQAAWGLGRGGAADRDALAVANLLAGNDPDAAVLEATVLPPTLVALGGVVLALAGADLGYVLEPGGRSLVPPCVVTLEPGDRLVPGGAAGRGTTGTVARGARLYLAPVGGIDVPIVLGSRATVLPAGFGGLDGRSLAAGDRLGVLQPPGPGSRLRAADVGGPPHDGPIRILRGPFAGGRAGAQRIEVFVATTWTVSADSDRRGLRLVARGPTPLGPPGAAASPSHGVLPGTIQLTPDGTPLVLMPDAGPTGGYPVIAHVIAADLPQLGQLRPGADVRFRVASAPEAIAAERAHRAWLAALTALVESAGPTEAPDPWDDLWRSAGG